MFLVYAYRGVLLRKPLSVLLQVALLIVDLYMREKVLLHTVLVDVAQARNEFRQVTGGARAHSH